MSTRIGAIEGDSLRCTANNLDGKTPVVERMPVIRALNPGERLYHDPSETPQAKREAELALILASPLAVTGATALALEAAASGIVRKALIQMGISVFRSSILGDSNRKLATAKDTIHDSTSGHDSVIGNQDRNSSDFRGGEDGYRAGNKFEK